LKNRHRGCDYILHTSPTYAIRGSQGWNTGFRQETRETTMTTDLLNSLLEERETLTEKYLYLMNDIGAPKRIARLVKCRTRIAEINAEIARRAA